MRASRSVGKRAAQGLRTFANKAKGDGKGLKGGQAAAKATPAATATPAAPTAPAPPKAPAAAAASTPPPQPPTASPAAEAASKGSEGGQWIIHPSVPVDARLLGAGVAGAGLLLYNLSSSSKEEESAPAVITEVEEEPSSAAQEAAPQAEAEGGAPLADVAPQHVDEGFHLPQQEPQQAEAAAEKQQQQGEEEVQGPPTVVDGSKVLSVIEEVFTLDASQLLQQAYAQAAPEGTTPAAGAAGAAEPQVKAGGGDSKGGDGAAGGKGRRRRKGGGLSDADAEGLAAIQAGLADTAGEALASDLGKVPPKPAKAAAEPAAEVVEERTTVDAEVLSPHLLQELGPNVAQASSALAGVDPLVKEILGLQQDVTPAGLIQQAAAHGQGAGDDWVQYRHRHRQAVADAQFIAALLDAAAKNVKGVLEEKDRAIAQGRDALEAAQQALQRQGDQFRDLLRQALEDADRQAKTAMKLQAQQMAVAHAEVTVRERAERAAKVDEVRTKLNALEEAFKRRSNERRTSTEAHQISVGAFALQAALENGQPLRGALTYLSKACKDDALVTAALAALPASAVERGVPTRAQISAGFEDVQRLSRQLSWVPEGQGGLLTITLAKLASKLKVSERGTLAAGIPGEGIDRSLAVAQAELVNGQLLKAASDLEVAVAGTAAAAEVAPWVAAVRARVLAEQTAALLQAHASALTVSLA